jgi:Aspartate/ornithine carbamoyltransferase, carbamoyl-P binding domain
VLRFFGRDGQRGALLRKCSPEETGPNLDSSGKEIALIFEKTSTRTRSAFKVAAYDQGAHVTYLDPSGSQLGHEESIAGSLQRDKKGTSSAWEFLSYSHWSDRCVRRIARLRR